MWRKGPLEVGGPARHRNRLHLPIRPHRVGIDPPDSRRDRHRRGIALFTGTTGARGGAMVVCAVSILVNFLRLPYHPMWAITIIALNAVAIWAVATWHPDKDRARQPSPPARGTAKRTLDNEQCDKHEWSTGSRRCLRRRHRLRLLRRRPPWGSFGTSRRPNPTTYTRLGDRQRGWTSPQRRADRRLARHPFGTGHICSYLGSADTRVDRVRRPTPPTAGPSAKPISAIPAGLRYSERPRS
ncbi:DUF7144 family membrane protein [Rhodococcus koreensis]